MKIDTNSIQGYAGMTAEQKIAALEAFEYDDNSAKVQQLTNAVSKANSEAADWKRKHNALLDDDAKKKQEEADERQRLIDRNTELEKQIAITTYTNSYLELGYDKELAKSTAEALQAGDMNKVFENSQKHKKALEEKIKADLMKATPRPEGNVGGKKDDNSPGLEIARKIGKEKAEANKASADILKNYLK